MNISISTNLQPRFTAKATPAPVIDSISAELVAGFQTQMYQQLTHLSQLSHTAHWRFLKQQGIVSSSEPVPYGLPACHNVSQAQWIDKTNLITAERQAADPNRMMFLACLTRAIKAAERDAQRAEQFKVIKAMLKQKASRVLSWLSF